ncbi:MAG: EamA family transporter [Chroococcidiopsidaceae cyanobacterium CP_BM_RX_35]|nr:EamA family transporter [Chroococcidiopsidaceae cyanobacterium CP_BM_RX_35]
MPNPIKTKPLLPKQKDQQTSRQVRQRFAVAMIIVVLATSLGDVSLKGGLSQVPLPSADSLLAIPQAVLETLTNIWVDIAILLLIGQFIAWAHALRLAPYSLAIPLRASSYIFTALLALYVLQEPVPPMRWVAILIVLLGVIMVGVSGVEGDS